MKSPFSQLLLKLWQRLSQRHFVNTHHLQAHEQIIQLARKFDEGRSELQDIEKWIKALQKLKNSNPQTSAEKAFVDAAQMKFRGYIEKHVSRHSTWASA